MVIDDSKTVHGFLGKYLADADPPCELMGAPDGAAGLATLRAGAEPDLIFLDWEMPELDGPGTFAGLRAMGVQTPVIMLTSRNDVADIARMLEAGVDEYVMKPFTADVIYEKMSAVLRRPISRHGA